MSGGCLGDIYGMSEWYVECLDVSEGQNGTCQVRIGQVRIGQVRIDPVRTGQIRTGQLRTDQVRKGQVR